MAIRIQLSSKIPTNKSGYQETPRFEDKRSCAITFTTKVRDRLFPRCIVAEAVLKENGDGVTDTRHTFIAASFLLHPLARKLSCFHFAREIKHRRSQFHLLESQPCLDRKTVVFIKSKQVSQASLLKKCLFATSAILQFFW